MVHRTHVRCGIGICDILQGVEIYVLTRKQEMCQLHHALLDTAQTSQVMGYGGYDDIYK